VALDRGLTQEILVRHFMNRAGGVPASADDLARVVTPMPGDRQPALLQMARENTDEFLGGQYEDGPDGTVYEFEFIPLISMTTDGNPESPKVYSTSSWLDTDIRVMGPDKEAYRHNYLIDNNRAADDFSRIMEMAEAFTNLDGAALEARAAELIDVDQWLRTFAAESLAGNWDFYTHGPTHNMMLYVRPEDGRVLAFPHDMDHSFEREINAPLRASGGWNFSKVTARPGNLHAYYGHLKDILDASYNTAYMAGWSSHYAGLVGRDFGGYLNYIAERAAFVRGQLPAQVPFRITTNNGNDFTTGQAVVTIGGDAWIDVKQIFIDGRSQPLELTWSDVDSWSAVVALAPGQNQLTFRGYDFQGRPVQSDSITVTSTATGPDVTKDLRVTELHYHPADPPAGGAFDDDEFEFIELRNVGARPLPVGSVELLGGVTFTFPEMTLAPGQYVLVVNNRAAFESRYGTGLSSFIAGEYGGDLDNSGDHVRLEGAASQTILDFTYGDDDWHPAADGPGRSLVIRNPLGPASNWDAKEGWRPSTFAGGSPGAADPVAVAGRHVFYNRSAFDGNNPAANAADDAAIATDKRALLPGQTATFANYTSYSRGINGIMVDIAGLAAMPGAGDFSFKVGNDANVGAWTTLSTGPAVSVRLGAGVGGSDRVTLVWPDNAVQQKWLQVTVKATIGTGLASADVFYFGNAIGDAGNSAFDAAVNYADEQGARAHPRGPSNAAPVIFRWDFNRDRRVNSVDQLIARKHRTTAANDLNFITAPFGGALVSAPAARFATSRPTTKSPPLAFPCASPRPPAWAAVTPTAKPRRGAAENLAEVLA
jgi:hypothetical protein